MFKTTSTLCLSFLLFFPVFLNAQNWGMGFEAGVGLPTGNLKEASSGTVFPELSTSLIYEFWNLPIDLGLSVGYGMYGTKLEKRTDLYRGFSDELRLRRNNNLLSIMGMFRYLPEVDWKLKPFIELQGGTNYLYTRYKIRESRFEEPIEEDRDLANWIGAFRLGGGLKIPFKTPDDGFFQLKIMYQDTRRVEFLLKEGTKFDPEPKGGGTFSYQPVRSVLTWIQPSIGVVLYMNVYE